MSAFPVEVWLSRRCAAAFGVAAVAGAAALFATGAAAQDLTAGPVGLVPRDILRPAPVPEAPTQEQTGSALRMPHIPAPRIGDIEVNPLAQVAPDGLGVLGPESGGFGPDMWRGSDRGVVERLLERVPPAMSSRTMRALTRRLLLSAAAPPNGGSAGLSGGAQIVALQRAPEPASGLLALRARRLAALGEVPALVLLLSAVPTRLENESLERVRVDALFLAGDQDESCRLVRNGIAVHHDKEHWRKAMVYCHMAAGEMDRGMLTLDLLREQGGVDDPMFFALADRMMGLQTEMPGATAAAPLHMAMARAIGQSMAPDVLDRSGPGMLFAVANAPSATPERRAGAAERACAMGLIDGEALARAYEALSFAPEEIGDALSAAHALEGVRSRALLYQAARNETLPATRAEVVRVALDQAARAGLYPTVVPAFAPLIGEIQPDPQLTWFAATAGRALYAAGRYEEAGAWLMLGRQEAIIDPQASAAVAALWPYSRLAEGDAVALDGSLDGTLSAWRAMREAAGSQPSAGSQQLLRALFQALGERDPLPWSEIAAMGETGRSAVPDAALLYALKDASEARRVGETVLLSLIVFGEGGPAERHTLALAAVVSALARIGLESEARALAIEAAVADGI